MIVVASTIVLGLFLLFGWIIFSEMLQHRVWRRRVEQGDVGIVHALIEEALGTWRKARPPRGLPTQLWSGVQGAQLVAVTADSATLSASAEPAFRTEDGRRVQTSSALDEATALAARIVDMMLYDVPNLRLDAVRVDVFSTFTGADGAAVQQPILTTTATRADAEDVAWESLTPQEVLGRFATRFALGANGQALPIPLDPIEGSLPEPAEGVA
ncbi:MAG: hypothetical protein ACKVVT_01255 [Dehalococcoidia bacterium]